MPNIVDLWPYGWGGFEEAGIPLDEAHLANLLAAPLYVQLGTEDTDRLHKNLRSFLNFIIYSVIIYFAI